MKRVRLPKEIHENILYNLKNHGGCVIEGLCSMRIAPSRKGKSNSPFGESVFKKRIKFKNSLELKKKIQ